MGGTPHPDGAWTEPLPPCLRALARRAAAFFPDGRLPDQALVNEYVEGSGIAAHADGPLYEPCAVIVSLESSARLDFFTDGDERVASVLLRPRSVVAFADAAYLSLKHGIAAARADTVDDRVRNGAAISSYEYEKDGTVTAVLESGERVHGAGVLERVELHHQVRAAAQRLGARPDLLRRLHRAAGEAHDLLILLRVGPQETALDEARGGDHVRREHGERAGGDRALERERRVAQGHGRGAEVRVAGWLARPRRRGAARASRPRTRAWM